MDHFPTLEIESESNCVLPWLITGWEDRPSQQHNSIWAKYLYRGGTTSLIHNTFIHVRESYFQSGVRVIRSAWNIAASCWYLLRQAFQKTLFVSTREQQWASSSVFLEWFSLCFRLGGILPAVSGRSFCFCFSIFEKVGPRCSLFLKITQWINDEVLLLFGFFFFTEFRFLYHCLSLLDIYWNPLF